MYHLVLTRVYTGFYQIAWYKYQLDQKNFHLYLLSFSFFLGLFDTGIMVFLKKNAIKMGNKYYKEGAVRLVEMF